MDKFKKTALIGYTGFVGSNLYLDYHFDDVYNSKNINDIIGKEYDCIVCAGISAKKWYANLHSVEDFEQINSLLDILKKTKTKKFILISTIDIYDNVNAELDEDYVPDITYTNHAYGKNRLIAEKFVMNQYQDYIIIRLPGLFGFGLQKNIIFDYLNNNLKEVNVDSIFQWYDISDLYNDINKIINMDIKIINLFTQPIKNDLLLNLFVKYNNNLTINKIFGKPICYDMLTKYSTSGYWNKNVNMLDKIENYIDIMKNNKLIIGNLSWKHNNNFEMYHILKNYGIDSLEISPFKFFGLSANDINLNDIDLNNIDIYSFQAILYPHNGNIFGSENEKNDVKNYLFKIIDIASKSNAKILVFGSPKNRKKNELSYCEAFNIAIPFFKEIGDYAHSKNIILCIEPNAKSYNCDFITNSNEGRELVLKVNSNGFKLHLDVGCMFLENENILDCIKTNLDILKHIHFSAPGLKSLICNDHIKYNELYREIIKIYNGKIAIEMLNCDDREIISSIKKCLI